MFKKLKSLFVVEEEVTDIEKQLENAVTKKKGQQTAVKSDASIKTEAVAEIFDSNVSGPVKPNKKFTNILLKAIESQNLDGADYLEFKESLKSLESVIDDETTRYKSSFAVLKNGGVTKEKLLSSGQHYINVLAEERNKFESTFKAQQAKQVKSRETKIISYQAGIEKKRQQLKNLIVEIETMEKKLETSKVEINQAAGKVQLTKDQFLASYGMIVNQIQADFDKINEHL